MTIFTIVMCYSYITFTIFLNGHETVFLSFLKLIVLFFLHIIEMLNIHRKQQYGTKLFDLHWIQEKVGPFMIVNPLHKPI